VVSLEWFGMEFAGKVVKMQECGKIYSRHLQLHGVSLNHLMCDAILLVTGQIS